MSEESITGPAASFVVLFSCLMKQRFPKQKLLSTSSYMLHSNILWQGELHNPTPGLEYEYPFRLSLLKSPSFICN